MPSGIPLSPPRASHRSKVRSAVPTPHTMREVIPRRVTENLGRPLPEGMDRGRLALPCRTLEQHPMGCSTRRIAKEHRATDRRGPGRVETRRPRRNPRPAKADAMHPACRGRNFADDGMGTRSLPHGIEGRCSIPPHVLQNAAAKRNIGLIDGVAIVPKPRTQPGRHGIGVEGGPGSIDPAESPIDLPIGRTTGLAREVHSPPMLPTRPPRPLHLARTCPPYGAQRPAARPLASTSREQSPPPCPTSPVGHEPRIALREVCGDALGVRHGMCYARRGSGQFVATGVGH
jgi:hypothetical protein